MKNASAMSINALPACNICILSLKFGLNQIILRLFSAILLLFVFALYHLGYYVIYRSLDIRLDQNWEAKILHNDFQQDRIFQRVIPITFPYQPEQKDLINFELTVGTEAYRILKYTYQRDTLIITYARDKMKDGINKSFDEWSDSFSQKSMPENNTARLIISFVKNYLPRYESSLLQEPDAPVNIYHWDYFRHVLNNYIEIPVPPPKEYFYI